MNEQRKQAQTREAAVWASAGKIAQTDGDRKLIDEGSNQLVALNIAGTVAGDPVHVQRFGRLKIGHDSTTSSPQAAPAKNLAAFLLSKLLPQVREKMLYELPRQFVSRAGELPPVDEERLAEADKLLKSLRVKRTVPKTRSLIFEELTPEAYAAEASNADPDDAS